MEGNKWNDAVNSWWDAWSSVQYQLISFFLQRLLISVFLMLLLIWQDWFAFPGLDSAYLRGVPECGTVGPCIGNGFDLAPSALLRSGMTGKTLRHPVGHRCGKPVHVKSLNTVPGFTWRACSVFQRVPKRTGFWLPFAWGSQQPRRRQASLFQTTHQTRIRFLSSSRAEFLFARQFVFQF